MSKLLGWIVQLAALALCVLLMIVSPLWMVLGGGRETAISLLRGEND